MWKKANKTLELTKTTSTGGPVQSARPTPIRYDCTVPYQLSKHNK